MQQQLSNEDDNLIFRILLPDINLLLPQLLTSGQQKKDVCES